MQGSLLSIFSLENCCNLANKMGCTFGVKLTLLIIYIPVIIETLIKLDVAFRSFSQIWPLPLTVVRFCNVHSCAKTETLMLKRGLFPFFVMFFPSTVIFGYELKQLGHFYNPLMLWCSIKMIITQCHNHLISQLKIPGFIDKNKTTFHYTKM